MTNQPIWKLIANLGDVSFADYGGTLVYVDETGAYPPEAETYVSLDQEPYGGEVYRYAIDRLKEVDGKLILFSWDTTWHYPSSKYAEWFDESTEHVAKYAGVSNELYRAMFCSDDPSMRAYAYEALGSFFGYSNLHDDPLTLTEEEAQERYKDVKVTA